MLNLLDTTLVNIPIPLNITWWWNFGSLLSLCLMVQLSTGLFLAMHYYSTLDLAFSSVAHIEQDVNYGWGFRYLHSNGASFIFLCLYLHIFRGIYFSSYTLPQTWVVGVSLLLTTIATAFLGYVLPWGQISLWGATVITNLLSSLPYFGPLTVQWLWGGASVGAPTLSRFFAFHFFLPFILSALTLLHVLFLHQSGSSNPLGVNSSLSSIPFHPFHSVNDILGSLWLLAFLLLISFFAPFLLGDPENLSNANPTNSPLHINPEWYYLFAYAILRAIPNNLGGVVALSGAVLILYALPFYSLNTANSLQFYPTNNFLFFGFLSSGCLLTWVGAQSVEPPFEAASQSLTCCYFSFFFLDPIFAWYWQKELGVQPTPLNSAPPNDGV